MEVCEDRLIVGSSKFGENILRMGSGGGWVRGYTASVNVGVFTNIVNHGKSILNISASIFFILRKVFRGTSLF